MLMYAGICVCIYLADSMSAKYNMQALGTSLWLRLPVHLPTPIFNH